MEFKLDKEDNKNIKGVSDIEKLVESIDWISQ